MANPLQVQLINGISNKKLGKEEELDVKAERLKEQLKQIGEACCIRVVLPQHVSKTIFFVDNCFELMNILIHAYAVGRDMEEALAFVRKMKDEGIEMSLVTSSILVAGFAKVGNNTLKKEKN
ncbi:hypothetical protein CsSME_00024633 [Camellia sinensis var. sinensis]